MRELRTKIATDQLMIAGPLCFCSLTIKRIELFVSEIFVEDRLHKIFVK